MPGPIKVDAEAVKLADSARAMWGDKAAEWCEAWAKGHNNPVYRAKFAAAAKLIREQDAA